MNRPVHRSPIEWVYDHPELLLVVVLAAILGLVVLR